MIDSSDVTGMSDHLIDPSDSTYGAKDAVRIDMDAVDQLYLSVAGDGGQWSKTSQTTNGYDIYVHDTHTGTAGNSENAYVMVTHGATVHLNETPPAH